jgi:3-phenylpropionate/cinnamic acid dioxygenase small subunit
MVSGSSSSSGTLLRSDDPEYVDVLMFLIAEAEYLDANDLSAWLSLLAPEVSYAMPVQTSRLREDPGSGSSRSFHFKEDRATLELRVKRLLDGTSVWASNPAPRTRRFISNVRVRRTESEGLWASSYLLLLRSRHDHESYELISGERKDLLVRGASGELTLRNREITVDQTRLNVASLPVPL